MASFATCPLENLTVNADNTLSCTAWEFREVMFPLYELSQSELHELMALTAGFLALMFSGKMLLRWLLNVATSAPSTD